MLITKFSNDFYDKAIQMESSDCGIFTTNTVPAQGEEFGFYLYNLNNFTEYDGFRHRCEGTDTYGYENSVEGWLHTTAFSTAKRLLITGDVRGLASSSRRPCWDYYLPLSPLYSLCFTERLLLRRFSWSS